MSLSFPPDWTRTHLREVASVQTGVAKGKRNLRSPVMRPYLRVANVHDGFLKLDTIKEIAVEESEAARYELKSGDVLLTEGGDNDKLGRGTVWNGEIAGCLHQNHIFAVRPNSDRLLPSYLAALIGSRYGRAYFDGSAKQTTNLASINASQVRGFPLVIPGTTEQARIVSVLTALAEQLTTADALLSAKRRFKRGLAQQLLTGKRRFKEFERAPWNAVRIGELFEEVSRPIQYDDDAFYDLVSIRRRSGGVFHRSRTQGRAIKTKQLFEVREGDFLISKMQVVHGALGLVPTKLDGMKVSGSYVVLRNERPDLLHAAFFDQLSRLPQMYRQALLASYGVHIEKMTFNLEWYLRSTIRIPSLVQEQESITSTLTALDRELKLLEKFRDALDRQRRGVAELLLTGKIRVPA